MTLSGIGAFLTTERGGWTVVAITAAICASAWFSVGLSTFLLSVQAILLTQAVLAYQGRKEERDDARDVAAHKKLDELIHGVPKANDAVAGIEQS